MIYRGRQIGGPPPQAADLPVIAQAESGNRNIPGPDTDSGQAQGNYQITTGTWRDFAPQAGVDLSQYPTPLSAPWDVQGKVASVIPLSRWASKTRQAVAALGLGGDASTTSDALGANNYGIVNPGHMSMDQFAPILGRIEQNQADSEKATAGITADMQRTLGEDKARARKALDAAEPVDIPKWTQAPPKNDPVDGFASIGAIFAGLASAFTHTPAINAMNGMAAAINARNQGNQTAYKEAYQAWKDNTELAIKRQEIQSKAFTSALDLMQTDVAAGNAALKAAAATYGDRNALMWSETGLYEKVAESNSVSDRMAAQWKAQLDRLESSPQRAAERDIQTLADAKVTEQEKAAGHPLKPEEKAQIREQVRQEAKTAPISDEAADFTAGRVLAGDEAATVGMARSNANMTKVANAIVRQAKEQNVSPEELADRVAEFKGLMAGERTLGTRAANMEVAANVVRSMAPLVLETSKNVSRTEFPTLNSAIVAAQKGTGDPNVVRFAQAANALIYEYAKFLNPTGVPTDADKARSTDILNTAWSQGQLEAAIDQIVGKELPAGAAGITKTRMEFRDGMWRRGDPTTAAPQTSAPAGSQQAKPDSTPHPDTLPDGATVTQNGVKYRKTSGQWVPVQ